MPQELITKITHTITRSDGSEVRIVATGHIVRGPGLFQSVDLYVLRRHCAKSAWSLCSTKKHPDADRMGPAEYAAHGRPEHLRYASPAEQLKVLSLIGQPLGSERRLHT